MVRSFGFKCQNVKSKAGKMVLAESVSTAANAAEIEAIETAILGPACDRVTAQVEILGMTTFN